MKLAVQQPRPVETAKKAARQLFSRRPSFSTFNNRSVSQLIEACTTNAISSLDVRCAPPIHGKALKKAGQNVTKRAMIDRIFSPGKNRVSFLFVVVFFFVAFSLSVLSYWTIKMKWGGRRCYIVAVGAAVTVVFAQHNYQSVASSAAGLVPFDSNCLQCIRFYSDNNQKLKNKKVASHDVWATHSNEMCHFFVVVVVVAVVCSRRREWKSRVPRILTCALLQTPRHTWRPTFFLLFFFLFLSGFSLFCCCCWVGLVEKRRLAFVFVRSNTNRTRETNDGGVLRCACL